MSANLQSGALRARRGGHNPRQVRLAIEYTNLMNLAERSDFITVEAQDVHPGWPPEKYLITYRCRGIVGIESDGSPVYGDLHQVRMYMPSDYPLREPHLKWMTPIWHPNIDHELPNHVCTNTAQNYFAGKPLSDLVRAVGEMVQYVRYHAAWVPPYPLDRAAAKWVIEYAEPHGIVSKAKPVDDRPLLRPQRVRLYGAAPGAEAGPRVTPPDSAAPAAPDGAAPGRRRIKLGTSPLVLESRRAAFTEKVATAGKPQPGVLADEAPTEILAYRGAARPEAGSMAESPGIREPRKAGSVAQRLTGALERLRLRIGKSTRLCSSCSTSLPRDSRFCPRCGEATAQHSVACESCGSSLPLTARFCPRCGAAALREQYVS